MREAARVARRVVVLEWPFRQEVALPEGQTDLREQEEGPPLERRLSPERLQALFQQALGSPPVILQEEGFTLALWENPQGT